MRYCFYKMGLDSPGVDTWFRGMYDSMFESIRRAGDQVVFSLDVPDASCDVLVAPVGGGQDQSTARAMRIFPGRVVLYVPSARDWFRADFVERWRDKIVLAYGTDASENSKTQYAELGIPYLHLPFGSDPAVMRPLDLEPLFDAVFVGNARSGVGRFPYMDALFERVDRSRVLLVGPGWERYDVRAQSIAWGPLLNVVYGLGRVCINLHNDEQDCADRVDANNRLFDLAMAGRPQVSNAPCTVGRYFTRAEVPAFEDPSEWADAVVRFISDPASAAQVASAARVRAMRDHTWDARAHTLSCALDGALATASAPAVGGLGRLARIRDTALPSYGPREIARRIARRARRIAGGGKVG